jgi:hypothetical protein
VSAEVLLVVSGIVLVGSLSVMIELLGIKNPYWACLLAVLCVVCTALAHSWTVLLIGMALAVLYLMLRRVWEIRADGLGHPGR